MTLEKAVEVLKEMGWLIIPPKYIPQGELVTLEDLQNDTYYRAIYKYGHLGYEGVARKLGLTPIQFYKRTRILGVDTSKIYTRTIYSTKLKELSLKEDIL